MINIQSNILLSQKTFYGIGGPAQEFYQIDNLSGFPELWAETITQKIPKIILGKGSNIVFADKGFQGRVFFPNFQKSREISINKTTSIFEVEVGKNFQEFIEETNKSGFEDLTNLSGIPGNIGGFTRGNAGAYGSETADFIEAIEFLDESGITQKISKKSANFVYRGSIFKENPNLFITKVIFKLTKKDLNNPEKTPEKLLTNTKNLLKTRWQKYPAGRSGGCVFKNPPNNIAGKILDELGAKGDQIGDCQISEKHANFFVNKKQAKQKDLIQLIKKWQKIVWEKQQIKLEPEIYIIDEFGKKLIL